MSSDTLMSIVFGEYYKGVQEDPLHQNNGPEVDLYLLSVGLNPNDPDPKNKAWCMAFIYWCHWKAGITNLPRTGLVYKFYMESKNLNKVFTDTSQLQVGDIVMRLNPPHAGIVSRINGPNNIFYISGNTSKNGFSGDCYVDEHQLSLAVFTQYARYW
ncbi:hypothetical protein [Klebsiella quasipneumoniae]|uniref:hypothetical protein n=1 Tax=Klebsiella quasipneumoniae TaxID=1463165 RepID=UPI002169535F|nr:hypothetical protein [Klebsiella quasipneumoniae]